MLANFLDNIIFDISGVNNYKNQFVKDMDLAVIDSGYDEVQIF